MRSVSACSCVVLLLSVLAGQEVSALHAWRTRKEILHRIAKAQVTANPLLRRDGGDPTCASDHHSCPSTLGGDCCPSRYSCAVDSCYATTAALATGCGSSELYPCPAAEGGGCCKVGLICANSDCVPPASITSVVTNCPNNYFLCPSSLNYGCCPNGRGCALNQCYATEPVTATVTQTLTTTVGGRVSITTATATQVSTPTPPTGVATGDDRAAKFIPTSVPKIPASTPSSNADGGGGLGGAAIGGIVAGVVVLLIVVLVAAYLILRKLKHVEDEVKSKKESTAKSQSQAQRVLEEYGRQLHSPDYGSDNLSNDPLMTGTNSAVVTPQPGGLVDSRSRSDSNPLGGVTPSPNMFNFYEDRARHASPDSNVGYFDNIASSIQRPMHAARMRSSTESSTNGYPYAYTHYRQQSNASELSDGSDRGGVNSPLVPELDSTGYAELPSGQAGSGMHSRSGSMGGHARQRSNSSNNGGTTGNGQAPALGLTTLDESIEQPEIHGFYGRNNQQSGQTAAGLQVGWDVSSPVVFTPPGGGLPHQGSNFQDYPSPQPDQVYQQQHQGGYQHQHHGPDDFERPPPPPK